MYEESYKKENNYVVKKQKEKIIERNKRNLRSENDTYHKNKKCNYTATHVAAEKHSFNNTGS